MIKTYSIKEMSQLTSLTIRTLHYYDEINLLKPNRSKNGHRFYTEDNLIRLQHIIIMKYVGFSLTQIKKILKENNFNVIDSLRIQKQALIDEEIRIKKVNNLLHYIVNQYDLSQSIDWNAVNKIIQIIELKKESQNKWYEQYLTQNEVSIFSRFAKQRTEQWVKLFAETKKKLNSNPGCKSTKKIIEKWRMLAEEAYGDHPELKHKLWEAFKAGIIPGMPHDIDVITFLSRVVDKVSSKLSKDTEVAAHFENEFI